MADIKEKSINYIHGYNRVCSEDKSCLPYPLWYTGVKYAANNRLYKGTLEPTKRKRIIKKGKSTKELRTRKKKETTTEKLARARKEYEACN